MFNHNTRADFAAQLADEADTTRAVVLQIARVARTCESMDPKPMAISPKEDGIAI